MDPAGGAGPGRGQGEGRPPPSAEAAQAAYRPEGLSPAPEPANAPAPNPGRGFARFFEEMQSIRKAGHAISFGELDVGKVGIGAPVFREQRVAGSLCLVLTSAQYAAADKEFLVKKVLDSAAQISAPQARKIPSALRRPIMARSSSEKQLARTATARSR